MKAKELLEKDDKALRKLLTETQAKILKDRFAIAGREMTNVAEVNKSKKLIARINTVLRQREIMAVEEAAKKATASPADAKAKADKGEK